jgi:hypothetical protein
MLQIEMLLIVNFKAHQHAADCVRAAAVARCVTGLTRIGTEAVTATCLVSTDPNANIEWHMPGTCLKSKWATLSFVDDHSPYLHVLYADRPPHPTLHGLCI